MSFVDKEFIYFLLVFALVWHFTRGRYELKIAGMLALSLLFYGFHRWWLILLIGAYCIADWAAALAIERAKNKQGKKLALIAGIAFNLGVLAAWKYTPLLIVTINSITGWKLPGTEAIDGWFIPMGISFYGFSGIAYMVDVYRGVVKAEPSLVRFSLFTTFFPHLVAGPILRAKEFLTHLRPGELPSRPEAPLEGSFLIARGFFKKLVLADSIAIAIDPFFAHVSGGETAGVWSLPYVYLYALQIYFDFSGYTDIARGLGLWFGFRWPDNFNWPYLASSVQDFWRRWHMTLSRFLRDYLYVPLGGNRRGLAVQLGALFATMTLGGLWHGAGLTFVAWGAAHGIGLGLGVLWRRAGLPMPAALGWLLTFLFVTLTWVLFRAQSFEAALAMFKGLFGLAPAGHGFKWRAFVPAALVALAGPTAWAAVHRLKPRPALATALALLLVAALLRVGDDANFEFIYFQF